MESTVPSTPSRLNHHVVQAGAGAGKTRSLIEKVVSVFRHFRETEGKAPRLIVTTFTRKATQELRERLIVRACEEQDAELLDYVGNARSLQISTIHGVLNLFLGKVGHLCGLEAGFRIISEDEEQRLARAALKRTLLTTSEHLAWVEDYSFQSLLSLLMQFSDTYSRDPNLHPATTEDLRAARANRVEVWRAELIKAANAVLENDGGGGKEDKWTPFANELQAFARVWDGTSTGFENRPQKPRKNAKAWLAEETQEEIGKSLTKLKEDIDAFDAEVEFWPYFEEKWSSFFELGRQFHQEFWHAKLNDGLLSSSDLETFSLKQLRDQPALGGYFAADWDFWMIDEFQDTSVVQRELLRALRGPSASFIVGDPQQSIYLFRGAKSELFLEEIEAAKKSNAKFEELMVNYRSEPALLEFFNDFFSGYSKQFRPMQTRQPVADATLRVVDFISAPNEAEENDGILAHISRLIQTGARFDDICVLARTHAHLASVASVLKTKGIPVQVHSPNGFWRRREILDALALLKFLVHPHDNLTLLSLLRGPFFHIPDESLVEAMKSRPKSLWSLLNRENGETIGRLRELLELRQERGLVSAFEQGLRQSGLLDLAFRLDPAGRREANLWKLMARLKSEEKKPGFQVLTLVEEVEQWLGASEMMQKGDAVTAQEPNCVNMMTIHGSKGLEFDHVIIPRMGVAPNLTKSEDFFHHETDSLFTFRIYLESEGGTVSSPLDRMHLSGQRLRELAEQDRSLYVAMTRAKRSLALAWSDDQIEKDSWAFRGRLTNAERFSRSSMYAVEIHRPPFQFEFSNPWQSPILTPRPIWRTTPEGVVSQPRSVTQLTRASGPRLTIEQMRLRQKGATYGLNLHRAFQSLKVKPEIDWIKSVYPDLAEALQYVWDLETPKLRDVILGGQAEWGFKLKSKSGVIQGRLDLWGRDNSGKIWIVDYKSGRAKEDEAYWEQLRLYAWALHCFGHREPMGLALIHPLQKSSIVREFMETDLEKFEDLYGLDPCGGPASETFSI